MPRSLHAAVAFASLTVALLLSPAVRAEDEVPAAVSAPASVPAVAAEAPPPAPREPSIQVHISSVSPVELLRRAEQATTWEVVCQSPCNREQPVSGEYRIRGRDVPQTKDFRLSRTRVDLTVTTHVSDTQAFGIAFVVIGGAALVGGTVVWSVRFLGALYTNEPIKSTGPLVAFGLGTAMAVGGAMMIALSKPTTDVTGARPKPSDAYVRQPTWSAPPMQAIGKRGLTLPLQLSF